MIADGNGRIINMRIKIELFLGMDKVVRVLKMFFFFTLEVLDISKHI